MKTNRYAQNCSKCGQLVEVGAGKLEWVEEYGDAYTDASGTNPGHWEVSHIGECPQVPQEPDLSSFSAEIAELAKIAGDELKFFAGRKVWLPKDEHAETEHYRLKGVVDDFSESKEIIGKIIEHKQKYQVPSVDEKLALKALRIFERNTDR